MKVYIAIINDRHCDILVKPFLEVEKAISWVKEHIADNHNPEDYVEEDITGWSFFATYSCEGDYIRVMETELNLNKE